MTNATHDVSDIYLKYAAERDKRLRHDGLGQYARVTKVLTGYGVDPHQPVQAREPVTDHVTFAFIGGGFAGLTVGARLHEAGIDDVRLIDKAGDFGGVWYWNRYPGAMCDTSSLIYLPLLEETSYMPTEKYAHGPEIFEHARRIGRHYYLYDNALFHTEVLSVDWEQDASRWRITTNRGDSFTAQFVGVGLGPLHVAKVPDVPGIDSFAGVSFHTTQWDYGYTGGDADGAPMDKLADKRVGVIGTGATALQAVPELAKTCGDLFVVQRTPTSVDIRNNAPIDPEWFEQISAEPGWQQAWLDNFTANWEAYLGNAADHAELEDLVGDGWTDLGRRLRDAVAEIPAGELTEERFIQAMAGADLSKMEEIRARVDDVVADPRIAEGLKAWYSQLCKRPGFHDDYLRVFNQDNVHLVDTDGKGIERITERGVVINGEELELDCIIWATGFEYATDYASRTGFSLAGRDEATLAKHWADGMRTMHGMHMRGFPNLFLVQMLQAAFLGSNVPSNYADNARTIAQIVGHARGADIATMEVTAEAEQAWVDMLYERGRPFGSPECTPGYYNNEGSAVTDRDRYNVGYPDGAGAFFALMKQWRACGDFEGLTFS
ncbi:NAD(P)/FAD-dependent oxidoreductase [Gordonia sp. TBRC 11910]|uniref:NAD(P)/FAD-dependent oxidoreductase n=1 Tax=Gordonia asplenii TaxID=2725283 RepID=A0A848KWZ8_9ACTN|nr:NAD(P)/FAD-dependent oxidoreductase [Gordonia asplenii]NMN99987.1 NAD(P)/FAD-dependent oxidoreductase [Gordonia asplenii]